MSHLKRIGAVLMLLAAVVCGVGGAGVEGEGDVEQVREERVIQVSPRYYRWFVDPGVEWTETNTGYATLDWSIPLSQCALVLVDVWDRHYLTDTHARADAIVAAKIAPLLETCRGEGLTIVHAPGPKLAMEHHSPSDTESAQAEHEESPTIDEEWPPAAFRSKTGPYRQYAQPDEMRNEERERLRKALAIHPLAMPIDGEDVIATGEELHRYCKERGILFLFYLGFNTNACLLARDYGTLAMHQRGYEIIVLRDCTTGMESFETAKNLGQTTNAILMLEMFGKYSMTSEEFIAALRPD